MPHIDGRCTTAFSDYILHLGISGGAIERWEDPGFRAVYAEILKGNWKAHDPYDLQARLKVNSNIYGRPSQVMPQRSVTF
jgi:hypothetical protein